MYAGAAGFLFVFIFPAPINTTGFLGKHHKRIRTDDEQWVFRLFRNALFFVSGEWAVVSGFPIIRTSTIFASLTHHSPLTLLLTSTPSYGVIHRSFELNGDIFLLLIQQRLHKNNRCVIAAFIDIGPGAK